MGWREGACLCLIPSLLVAPSHDAALHRIVLQPGIATAPSTSQGKKSSFFRTLFGGGESRDEGKPAEDEKDQAFKPNVHPVELTVTVGPRGLGLILGKEEEGSRWVVKGFRAMPDGEPNPAEAAGIETGDTLQKLDGVALGSYKEGMEMFKKQSGSIVITVLRQDDITI